MIFRKLSRELLDNSDSKPIWKAVVLLLFYVLIIS